MIPQQILIINSRIIDFVRHKYLWRLHKKWTLGMNRYMFVSSVGDGAFGVVSKCIEKETGNVVAIKRMKERYRNWEDCLELKEVKSLRKINKAKPENVIEMKTVFRENDYLYIVFELCDESLLDVINSHPEGLPEPFIRNILIQLLKGLSAVHQQGFFHRDIKPENLLFCADILKIVDFGLAREIRSRPPYTQYAGTRWYRAPEILLRNQFYNSPIDIWAVGCIAAELYTLRPLFQGTSEIDQLFRIWGVLRSSDWPEGLKLAAKMGVKPVHVNGSGLRSVIPNASPEALNFIGKLLVLDPNRRLSAKKALSHPFLRGEVASLSELVRPTASRLAVLPQPIGVESRPRAAPVSPSPRDKLSRSWSQDHLDNVLKSPKKALDFRHPIDYRMFEFESHESDSLFDDI
jgi:protein kinase